MDWIIGFWSALAVLTIGCCLALYLKKPGNQNNITPLHVMLCSVFLSGFLMFVPVYQNTFGGETFQNGKAILWSIYSTLRLFVMDADFALLTEEMLQADPWMYAIYSGYCSVLLILAPILTFGIVLSFFKNLSAWCGYLLGYFKDVYIFSQLNEKSLVLAESLHRNDPRRVLVFTNVSHEEGEHSNTLTSQAKKLHASCFSKEIDQISFRCHSKRHGMHFFAIGENETENIEYSLKLIPGYREIPHTHLYVFSTQVEGELLLNKLDKGQMKVRRINDSRALVNRILYEKGETLFTGAVDSDHGTKQISAVVVGMGHHGLSMVKALSWFCQMDGYELTIDVFDKDPQAYDRLFIQCPELLSKQYNGITVPGEAQYRICPHRKFDVHGRAFAKTIATLNQTTYVLVALGNDEENIRAAVYLRMLFEQNGAKPVIQSIVYNSDKVKALEGITNYKGQPYHIDFIGDLEHSYSEDVILNSELEREALSRHLKWGCEDDFWNYEYNYNSSVASALHMRVREALQVPGAGKQEQELTTEERDQLEVLEHRRWNAYMRSEGYVYSGSTDSSSRNDLGKMHNDLVVFELLAEEEKRKDSQVGSR